MRLKGHEPIWFTLGSVLTVCSSLGLIQTGEMIHGYVVKNGFESNVFVVTGFVDMYVRCKCISEAEFLFNGLAFDRKNHVCNECISTIVENKVTMLDATTDVTHANINIVYKI